MTQIRLKRGTTVPLASDLVTGELAIDTSTGTVYTKKDDDTVVAISGGGGGGGGDYLPLAGGTMTGAIVFDGSGGQNINKGSFDSGMGGYNGISLYCAVGYELNWQAGWLTSSYWFGSTGFLPIKIDSGAGSTLQVFDKSTGFGTEISHTGITFSDSTSQTTAGIPDAPSDSTQYVRQNGSWVTNSGFTFGDSPSDGNYYVRMGSTGWAQIGSGTDTIATQNYVTSQGYATTGDVSAAVSGLVSTSNARKQGVVDSVRSVINEYGIFVDGSSYLNIPLATGALNFQVSGGDFSSSGKWFGFIDPVGGVNVLSVQSISLSSGVVTMVFPYSSFLTNSHLYYTEDGGTTWVSSTFRIA